jgi:hypothetical protein
MILKESSKVQETQSGREIRILTVKGEIPCGLRFSWEDTTGEHSVAEATTKQAWDWAHNTAKRISTSDSFTNLTTAIEEIQTADTIRKAEVLKEFRKEVHVWFGQFRPTDRQWKIVLVAVSELADRFIWLLVKYFEGKVAGKLTVHWEVEPLPNDGGIYQMLLKGGSSEGFHNNSGLR